MVSTTVMNYLMEIAVISFVFPVVLLVIWRLRTRKNVRLYQSAVLCGSHCD